MGPFPSVAGQKEKPVIAIDIHTCLGVAFGKCSDLETIAAGKGWSLSRLDLKGITMKSLVDRKVLLFVVSGPKDPYSDQELEELKAFVENGGSLIVEFSENGSFTEPPAQLQYAREIIKRFGIDVVLRFPAILGLNSLSGTVTVPVSSRHPLLANVSKVAFDYCCGISLFLLVTKSPAIIVAEVGSFEPPEGVIAAFEHPSGGKVVVYTRGMSGAGQSGKADNAMFLANILRWIAPPELTAPLLPIAREIDALKADKEALQAQLSKANQDLSNTRLELQRVQSDLARIRSEATSLSDRVRALEGELTGTKEQQSRTERELSATRQELTATRQQLNVAQGETEKVRTEYKVLVQEKEVLGQAANLLTGTAIALGIIAAAFGVLLYKARGRREKR